jgi:hypothetical protein
MLIGLLRFQILQGRYFWLIARLFPSLANMSVKDGTNVINRHSYQQDMHIVRSRSGETRVLVVPLQ